VIRIIDLKVLHRQQLSNIDALTKEIIKLKQKPNEYALATWDGLYFGTIKNNRFKENKCESYFPNHYINNVLDLKEG